MLDRTEIIPAMPAANTTAMAKTASESEAPPRPDWVRVEAASATTAGVGAGDQGGGEGEPSIADGASVISAVANVTTRADAGFEATAT